MLSQIRLNIPMFICSQPSISPKYSLDVPNYNPRICDANVNLSYEDNIFGMLGWNVQDYVFLGYLRGYDPSIDPYYVSPEGLPTKITWTTCCNPFYDYSIGFDKS